MEITTSFRIALPSDWPAVISIYNQGIDDGYCNAFTEHLTVQGHMPWLEIHDGVNYAIFIAEAGRSVVGWCSLSPYRIERKAFGKTGEISYYFDRNFRGKGIGYRLVSHTIEKAPGYGLDTLLAFLLDINIVSTKLLEKLGFARWGHLHGVADFGNKTCGQYIYGKSLGKCDQPV